MQRHLYFICTTDYSKPVINNLFKQRHYYYTSLGNSVIFDNETIEDVQNLIEKHSIKEVFFVLSSDNQIVLNALRNPENSKISSLNHFNAEIAKQKERLETSWQTKNHLFSILSYYLNQRISELRSKLDAWSSSLVTISGKIYDKQEHLFKEIHSELICGEYFNLN